MKNNEKPSPRPNCGLSSDAVEAVMLAGIAENVEQQLTAELQAAKQQARRDNSAPELITDFDKLPPELVFSSQSVYKLYNRDNGLEFLIDGKNLEARIGLDDALYNKLKSRSVKVFNLDNAIISFLQASI